jgi:selenoprotein W-related protein
LKGWAPIVVAIELVPSSGGRFEVTLDSERIFSKANLGRHAKPGEIAALLRERIGPEIPQA